MKENRIVEPILYYKMVEELAIYLPEDVRNHIITSITIRENMKYKGPNRALQTAGIIAETLPYITDALAKAKTDRKEFIEKISSLEKEYLDLRKKIKGKDQEINEIKSKKQRTEEILIKVTKILLEYVTGRKIEKKVYQKTISDLYRALILIKPDETEEYIKHIINRYSQENSEAKKCFINARKELKLDS